MSNVWLVRPIPHGTNQMRYFLVENRIAIGYPIGEDLSGYTHGEIRKLLVKKGWETGIGNVIRLVHQMREGDIVVVPDDNARDVYFGKITSDYIYVSELDVDMDGSGFPHQRAVEWYFGKNPVSRSELPEALLKSLRFPGTVAELTKHLPLVAEIIGELDFIAPEEEQQPSEVIEMPSSLYEKSIQVLGRLLESDDPQIALRAAEIVLNHGRIQPR
jgi:restriction system protein